MVRSADMAHHDGAFVVGWRRNIAADMAAC